MLIPAGILSITGETVADFHVGVSQPCDGTPESRLALIKHGNGKMQHGANLRPAFLELPATTKGDIGAMV